MAASSSSAGTLSKKEIISQMTMGRVMIKMGDGESRIGVDEIQVAEDDVPWQQVAHERRHARHQNENADAPLAILGDGIGSRQAQQKRKARGQACNDQTVHQVFEEIILGENRAEVFQGR